MILQVWGGAGALIAAALVIGHALDRLAGRSGGAAPAVGLAALIIVADTGMQLPGRATTTAVLCLILVVASVVVLVVRRPRPVARPVASSPGRRWWRRSSGWASDAGVQVVTGGLAALAAAVPFIANGRVGLPGVSLDDDTANHMVWALALQKPAVGTRYGLPSGYPLGPHSLVDALSSLLGLRLDLGFTALMIASMVLLALVGQAVMRGQSPYSRVVCGLCAAFFYLVAAYYAEGSFKEPLMGMLLLALVLQLEELRYRTPERLRERLGLLVVAAVLVAAAFYVYSYTAIAWIGLTIAIWLIGELVFRPGWLKVIRRNPLPYVVPALVACAVALVLLLPTAGRISSFASSLGASPSGSGEITSTNMGNLAGPLSPYEALGLWDRTDFRFYPASLFHAGELGALALGVLIFGVGWAINRRELILPAAVAACWIVWWHSRGGQSPYVTAKALVIAAPLIAAVGIRGLMSRPVQPLPRLPTLARAGVALVFLAFAGISSFEVLRDEPVWPSDSTNELLTLADATRGSTVLFLGASDYAHWLFADSDMSALAMNSVSLSQALPRAGKSNAYGTAFDFDSVDPATINRFQWLITTNTDFNSQAPPGLELVRRLRFYELWRRVGTIPARQVIEGPNAPGAVLNCSTPAGRALSRRHGIAAVMTAPVAQPVPVLIPGASTTVPLHLPAGRWQLSLAYVSAVDVHLSAGGTSWKMPAYLDRPGPVFAVGTTTSTGAAMPLTVRADKPTLVTGPNLVAQQMTVFATRLPDSRTIVPLSQACGRYVDWYRLSA